MHKAISLKNSRFPKIFADLTHSNQFLKVFAATSLLMSLLTLVTLFFQLNKDPFVIALTNDGKSFERILIPKAEDQIKEGVKHYLQKRFQWEPKDVIKKLKESESFVLPGSLKAFQAAVTNVSKFSIEKTVSQTVYPTQIDVDLVRKVAFVKGDRVTSIQGLKAAGTLNMQLHFDSGPRTVQNPWGVYITKEKEE
jgi:hypothetical protein